jgi:DNA polymerase III, chi subunit
MLWTYRPDSFLAHGRMGDSNAELQPIWVTSRVENPNNAQTLFIVGGADLGETKGIERCFILFDGTDDMALQQARVRWKALKDAGETLAYWRQSPEGRWERAA